MCDLRRVSMGYRERALLLNGGDPEVPHRVLHGEGGGAFGTGEGCGVESTEACSTVRAYQRASTSSGVKEPMERVRAATVLAGETR